MTPDKEVSAQHSHFEGNTSPLASTAISSQQSGEMAFTMKEYVNMQIQGVSDRFDLKIQNLETGINQKLQKLDQLPTKWGNFLLFVSAIVTVLTILGIASAIWDGGVSFGSSIGEVFSQNTLAIEENRRQDEQTKQALESVLGRLDELLPRLEGKEAPARD